MADHTDPATASRLAQMQLFDRRFEFVSITTTLRSSNEAGVLDALVRCYGTRPTTCIYAEDWSDIHASQLGLLLVDMAAITAELTDRHFGPF